MRNRWQRTLRRVRRHIAMRDAAADRRRLRLGAVFAAALGIVGACATNPSMVPDQASSAYVEKSSAFTNFEIRAGELALARSADPKVRRIAQTLSANARERVRELREAIGVSDLDLVPSGGVTSRQDSYLVRLAEAAPEDFDALYLSLQRREQDEALKAHLAYGRSGSVPALRVAAYDSLPEIEAVIAALPASEAERVFQVAGN